jgi:hypothetical protein
MVASNNNKYYTVPRPPEFPNLPESQANMQVKKRTSKASRAKGYDHAQTRVLGLGESSTQAPGITMFLLLSQRHGLMAQRDIAV